MSKQFYVYILASKRNGTLYTGVTSNLPQRIWQRKNDQIDGFSKKYNISNSLSSLKSMILQKAPFLERSKSRNGTGPGN